jgi:hypothetical protein
MDSIGHFAKPFAICNGIEPTHANDRLFGTIEARIAPKRWRRIARRCNEGFIVSISHLEDPEFEAAYINAVNWPLFVLSFLGSH